MVIVKSKTTGFYFFILKNTLNKKQFNLQLHLEP